MPLNPLKKLFKQTAIYGLATVLPRAFSILLLPLYTSVFTEASGYGEYTNIYAWIAIFNVFLAYGMETTFFRFYHKEVKREEIVSTSLISLTVSSILFLVIALSLKGFLAELTNINVDYIKYTIYILVLDALVIIPFALLRAQEKPMKYAVLKIINVAINLGLNVFLLIYLPKLALGNPEGFWTKIYVPNNEITYIFISNMVASGITLLMLSPTYFGISYKFDFQQWKKMLAYAGPIMVAGIAFTINEVFDKILLTEMLPEDIAERETGMYAACYKLGMFMALFATAFRMGIEPFFFSHSGSKNPQKAYAQITNYFVILGSVILLAVIVFADVLKVLFVRDEAYWEAMSIVPLILLASFFLGIYHNLSVWYKVTDKTKVGAYISIIGAILTLVINIVFIPTFGYKASAVATVVAYGSMMLLSLFFGQMYYPVPYNFRKIVFYMSISILFSTLSFYVFDRNLYIGIVLLTIFLGLVYRMESDKLRKIFLKKTITVDGEEY